MTLNSCFVEPEGPVDPKVQQPASCLRGVFTLYAKVASAELAITACGVYECFVNGKRVTDQVFMPGFTYYRERLQYQTYDVTDLLAEGANVVGVVLGRGSHRHAFGRVGRPAHHRSRLARDAGWAHPGERLEGRRGLRRADGDRRLVRAGL